MTACAAKLSNSAMSLSEKARTSRRAHDHAEQCMFATQRDEEHRSEAALGGGAENRMVELPYIDDVTEPLPADQRPSRGMFGGRIALAQLAGKIVWQAMLGDRTEGLALV